jgi:hypothetical protein
VLAELVENGENLPDLADAFVVALNGEKRISTSRMHAPAYSAAKPTLRRPIAVLETVRAGRVGLSSPTANRVRSARSMLRRAVRSLVT